MKITVFLMMVLPSVFVNALAEVCPVGVKPQSCIDSVGNGRIVELSQGVHLTSGLLIPSNLTLIIPKGAILKLDDNASLNKEAFGGVANSVIAAVGSKDLPLEGIKLIIDGTVDGNKNVHKYQDGGVEGVDWKWVKNSSILGSGTIQNANGDGIDLDAVYDIEISGVTVADNGGSGIHFGSPRPIVGSERNIVKDVISVRNGFDLERNGFDLSWPNSFGAIYIRCQAIDNYRNFSIEAEGGVVYLSSSIDRGEVVKGDVYSGASFVLVNGEQITNPDFVLKKTRVLIKRDVKRLLGISYPDYLDGVSY